MTEQNLYLSLLRLLLSHHWAWSAPWMPTFSPTFGTHFFLLLFVVFINTFGSVGPTLILLHVREPRFKLIDFIIDRTPFLRAFGSDMPYLIAPVATNLFSTGLISIRLIIGWISFIFIELGCCIGPDVFVFRLGVRILSSRVCPLVIAVIVIPVSISISVSVSVSVGVEVRIETILSHVWVKVLVAGWLQTNFDTTWFWVFE